MPTDALNYFRTAH